MKGLLPGYQKYYRRWDNFSAPRFGASRFPAPQESILQVAEH